MVELTQTSAISTGSNQLWQLLPERHWQPLPSSSVEFLFLFRRQPLSADLWSLFLNNCKGILLISLLKQMWKPLRSDVRLVACWNCMKINGAVREKHEIILFIDWRLCSQRVYGCSAIVFAETLSFTKTTKSICRFFGIQGDYRKRFCFSSGAKVVCAFGHHKTKQQAENKIFYTLWFHQFIPYSLWRSCRNMAEVEENFENFEEQPVVAEEAQIDLQSLAQPSEVADVKLFGRWSCDDVHVSDMSLAVSLTWRSIGITSSVWLKVSICRITSLSKRSTPDSHHIQLVDMPPNVSARLNAQSLSD